MTIDEFVKKYNGKKVDADGVYGYQCVDLIKKYFPEVIGIPAIKGNAIDYWTKYSKKYFTRYPNTRTFLPKKGDIVIWGSTRSPGWDGKNMGEYGHIGIVVSANLLNFTSLEQNWEGTGKLPTKLVKHSYRAVKGFLRPKLEEDMYKEKYEKAMEELKVAKEKWAYWSKVGQKCREELNKANEKIKELEKKLNEKKEMTMDKINLPDPLQGYKTYIGTIITALGALGVPQLLGGDEKFYATANIVLVVIGLLITLYGRYMAGRRGE